MKGYFKRFFSAILAALLLVSVSPLVCADNAAADGFEYYFCIGDSITSGKYGDMSGMYKDECGWIQNSYPQLICENVGLADNSKRYMGAHAGWRTNEVIYLLDDDYSPDESLLNSAWTKYWGGFDLQYLTNLRPAYREALSKADLITIYLGSNDVISNYNLAISEVRDYHTAGTGLDHAVINALEEAKTDAGDGEPLLPVLEAMSTLVQDQLLLRHIISTYLKINANFAPNWDRLIKSVLNYARPDATIIVIGLYNPVKTYFAKKSDFPDSVIEMAKLLSDPNVALFNSYMRSGSRYCSRYTYVDVTDIDMTGTGDGNHPGAAGHRFIADRVMEAIDRIIHCDHSYGKTVVNARERELLRFGYSGDVQCSRCGATLQKGHLLSPLLLTNVDRGQAFIDRVTTGK